MSRHTYTVLLSRYIEYEIDRRDDGDRKVLASEMLWPSMALHLVSWRSTVFDRGLFLYRDDQASCCLSTILQLVGNSQ
jgi:hypothetical protein